jgi:3-keto-5-aminohexanoate cleavage enzyme
MRRSGRYPGRHNQEDQGMQKKVIISVAPVGTWGAGEGNPLSPRDVSAQVIECAKAGAAMVHMHCRDESGALTTDLTTFNATVDLIKASCDIIIEASTGGISSMSALERTLPATNRHAQLASLNVGSFNLGDKVYQNSVPDIRLWIQRLGELGIKPAMEVFEAGNMNFALKLISEGTMPAPHNFIFVCNLDWGMPFHPTLLSYLRDQVPAGSNFGVNLINSSDFKQHLEVAHLGAAILRVGFEDSRRYNGKVAATNQEMVAALRAELEAEGFAIATPDEARAILLG